MFLTTKSALRVPSAAQGREAIQDNPPGACKRDGTIFSRQRSLVIHFSKNPSRTSPRRNPRGLQLTLEFHNVLIRNAILGDQLLDLVKHVVPFLTRSREMGKLADFVVHVEPICLLVRMDGNMDRLGGNFAISNGDDKEQDLHNAREVDDVRHELSGNVLAVSGTGRSVNGDVTQGLSDVRGLVPVVRQLVEDDGTGDRHNDGEAGAGSYSQATDNGCEGCNHRLARLSEIRLNKFC